MGAKETTSSLLPSTQQNQENTPLARIAPVANPRQVPLGRRHDGGQQNLNPPRSIDPKKIRYSLKPHPFSTPHRINQSVGIAKDPRPVRPDRRAGLANLLGVFRQELLTQRCVIPAKTRGGGRKIVPDRAVSLLKWRITSFPSAPLPNSASKYSQCDADLQANFFDFSESSVFPRPTSFLSVFDPCSSVAKMEAIMLHSILLEETVWTAA